MPKPARKTTNSGRAGCVRKYSPNRAKSADPQTLSNRTKPMSSRANPTCIMIT